MCRRLLARGYSVIGVGRQPAARFAYSQADFRYASIDLESSLDVFRELLESAQPDLTFHVAALHASAGLAHYETLFPRMVAVNVTVMHAVLEYLRVHNGEGRALYASSAKVFGESMPARVDEGTSKTSACLYSLTKNAAGDLIRYYRARHGCAASEVYLFNHESELRPEPFFIPKLVRAFAAVALGVPVQDRFATLDFYCDWGSAAEYMDIAIDCLERAPAEDFVLAMGCAVHARSLVERVAARLGIVPDQIFAAAPPPSDGQRMYSVDTSKLANKVARTPKIEIDDLVIELVAAAVSRAESGGSRS